MQRLAEGVGFEPTVGFPTLDFESSALNRTQPPFLEERRKRRTRLRQKLRRGKRRTSNIQHRMQPSSRFGVQLWALYSAHRLARPDGSGRQDSLPHEAKKCYNFGLPGLTSLLHLVCPHGQPRYYLLLTGIHRFLAPLFTSIPSLFEPQPLSYRHDSTQTRNSARVTK
jgi:hypothetical protein